MHTYAAVSQWRQGDFKTSISIEPQPQLVSFYLRGLEKYDQTFRILEGVTRKHLIWNMLGPQLADPMLSIHRFHPTVPAAELQSRIGSIAGDAFFAQLEIWNFCAIQ